MTDEEIVLQKRFIELAEKSFQGNIYTFTGFLGMAEQNLFLQVQSKIRHVKYRMYGGRNLADRVMIRFGDEEEYGYTEDFPITCIHVEPLQKKYADDLTHRDFLGAIMNLGINRSEVGDIVVTDREAYIFCTEKMTPYIMEQLDRIRHTNVKCSIASEIPEQARVKLETVMIQASSERIDGVIAKVYKLSRSDSLELFRQAKVYVNGRICESNSLNLKKDDVISVRGYGKFCYRGSINITRKGKENIQIEKYI